MGKLTAQHREPALKKGKRPRLLIRHGDTWLRYLHGDEQPPDSGLYWCEDCRDFLSSDHLGNYYHSSASARQLYDLSVRGFNWARKSSRYRATRGSTKFNFLENRWATLDRLLGDLPEE